MCPDCGRILVVCRCVGLLVPLVRRIAECALFLCAVPQNSKPQTGGTKNVEQKIRSTGGGNRNYRDLRRLRQLSPGCRSRLPCPSGTDRENSLYDAIQRQQSSNYRTGIGFGTVLVLPVLRRQTLPAQSQSESLVPERVVGISVSRSESSSQCQEHRSLQRLRKQ